MNIVRAGLRHLASVVILCLVVAVPVGAQGGALKAVLSDASAARPAITVKNTSGAPCQVLATAQGTVAITQLMQHGKVVVPNDIDSAADEDIGYLLKNHFKTLNAGEELVVPLQSAALAGGQTIRSTAWSPEGGAYVTEYTVAADAAIQMDLTYTIPISPASGAPACAGPAFVTIGSDDNHRLVPYLAAGLLVTVVCGMAVWYWFVYRKRRHVSRKITPPTAALLVLGVVVGVCVATSQKASAEVVVAPELQAAYAACSGTLEANRDITGPVLNVLNAAGVRVQIVATRGGSETTGRRDGSNEIFTIYWNPNDRHPYAGTGGAADPCTSLYHEMYHVLDMHNGTFNRNDCAGSGIETKEVMATRAQNALRVRLGMPARSHYGERALPSGDCNAPPRAPACAGSRCADSNGDPHLLTFDGLRYDFQAAGEFIAARDADGSFVVHVRQQPWGDSRSVSVNTAAAFKLGNDVVEVRSGKTMAMLVNGKAVAQANAKLPGGGSIEIESGVIVLHWPGQSVAYVRSVGSYGIALSLDPAEEFAGKLSGLFGNADGDPQNDLVLQGKKTVIEPVFEQLYPAYADSWRVGGDSSLFTYENGQTTATFTDRTMPEKPVLPAQLPGFAAAERYCKSLGITDPTVIANCAFDLAITGQPAFAKAAYFSQAFAAGGTRGATSWQAQRVADGTPVRQTFSGTAGEKVFIHVSKTSLPDQCGTLRLLAADGSQVADGCIIHGKGFVDGTVLPADGTYTIELKPQGSGDVAIKLLRITDKTGTLFIDGKSAEIAISQPGTVGRYTFAGKAGQRVYTRIPKSTLGSQCGILQLLGTDGKLLSNGCIINNVGSIDTVTLPSDGTYTFIIDPNDTTIGTATVRLTAAELVSRNATANGSVQRVSLSKPGSVAELRFTGAAGQKLFADIPASTIPSQCGIVKLRKPDGTTHQSGCIINGKGELAGDGVTLDASGPYVLVLDPYDDATGTADIRLRTGN